MQTKDIKKAYRAHMLPTYAPYDAVLVKGSGCLATDIDGKTYLDFGSGIGVNALGYCDPDWVQAVCDQAAQLQHTSNLYYTLPAIGLADRLCTATPFDAVFFANSGAEANECAIKLARKASFDRYGPGRADIITLTDSFHGRTMATLSATGQPPLHEAFMPINPGFTYVPPDDIDAFKAAVTDSTCAVMLECVQGEGGVHILDRTYVQAVADYCRAKDLTLIIDEVQTGIGRTGKLFAYEHFGIQPDIITLAKGLGGGLPIGACLTTEALKPHFGTGSHGSTFGGNPVACAGAKVMLDRIANPAFLQKVEAKGQLLETCLATCPGIAKIDRLGLMVGLTPRDKAPKDVLDACLAKGLLILTAKNKIRLLPPLSISEEDLQKGCAILSAVLSEE